MNNTEISEQISRIYDVMAATEEAWQKCCIADTTYITMMEGLSQEIINTREIMEKLKKEIIKEAE